MAPSAPRFAPATVLLEWIALGAIPEQWEKAFYEAIESARQRGINCSVVRDPSIDHPELIVAALLADTHSEPHVVGAMADVHARLVFLPATRLAAAAVGGDGSAASLQDVHALVCADGKLGRRNKASVADPQDLLGIIDAWIDLVASDKSLSGGTPNPYVLDSLSEELIDKYSADESGSLPGWSV